MRLDAAFFARDCALVARDLLGSELVVPGVRMRVTETEAYLGPKDTAAHSSKGRTARTDVMFGPVGRAYVYKIYGIHWMLNIVAGEEGSGQALLVRACEPVEGHDVIASRRGGRTDPTSLAGPGKVAAALAIDGTYNRMDMTAEGPLEVHEGAPVTDILVGPRVGVDYAAPADRDALLRFAEAGTPWVSHPKTLYHPDLAPRGGVR